MQKPLVLFLILIQTAFPWRMMVIQTVSKTGKTFVTRSGKAEGIIEGVIGTFSVKDAAVVAQAVEVTRDFTVWKIKDAEAVAPFKKYEPVTFNFSEEAVFLKVPQPKKYEGGLVFKTAEEFYRGNDRRTLVESISIKGFQGQGLSESVSGVSASLEGNRRQFQLEFIYSNEIFDGIALEFGLRQDTENNAQSTFSITADRRYLTFGSTFSLYGIRFLGSVTPYLGLTIGAGLSSTNVDGSIQDGTALILPQGRAGLEILFSKHFAMQAELGFEALAITEELSTGEVQETNQTNGKFGIGLRYIF